MGVSRILWVLRNSKTKLAKAIFRNKIIQNEGKVVDSPLNTFTFFQARHCIHVCSTIHFRCSSLAYTVGAVGSLPAYYFDRLRFAVTPAVLFHILISNDKLNSGICSFCNILEYPTKVLLLNKFWDISPNIGTHRPHELQEVLVREKSSVSVSPSSVQRPLSGSRIMDDDGVSFHRIIDNQTPLSIKSCCLQSLTPENRHQTYIYF